MIYFEIIKKLPYGVSNGLASVFESEQTARDFFKYPLSHGYEIKKLIPLISPLDCSHYSNAELDLLIDSYHKKSDYDAFFNALCLERNGRE